MSNETYQPTSQPDNQSSTSNSISLLQAYSVLSRSECRVLKKMAEGKSNQQIAEELFVSKKTVENHIFKIGRSLNLKGKNRVRVWIKQERARF